MNFKSIKPKNGSVVKESYSFSREEVSTKQNLHWKCGQQTPSVATLLAYLETTA